MDYSELQLEQIKKTKILIVDDLPENLQMLGSTLREHGFQIAFATSGKQALSIAASKNPNLILLDMTMPEMDGLTVCRKIKENPQTRNIPVIFLTARVESETIMKALAHGAIDYVVKPFITTELLNRIITHLSIDKIDSITSEERENILWKEAVILLGGEFTRKWNEVKTSMFIDDVLSFAKSLLELAENNQVKPVTEYAENLSEAANLLRIDKMAEILDQFPQLLKKLSEN